MAAGGVTFGEFAAGPEPAVMWQGWRYEGSYTQVDKTDEWGRVQLQDGEAAVSPVIDLTNTGNKYLTIALNAYQNAFLSNHYL